MYKLGLIGYPLGHSLSAVIQKAGFESIGVSGTYEILETPPDSLIERVKYLKINDYNGFNVTIPLKVPISLFLEEIDETASLAGCANTVKIMDDRSFKGFNTDIYGFWAALPKNIDLSGKTAGIIGTGGASRAATIGLIQAGIKEINYYSRNIINAAEMINAMRERFPEIKFNSYQVQMIRDLSDLAILVNCTPVGMRGNSMDLAPVTKYDIEKMNKEAIVYDVIYNPTKTLLLQYAEECGLKTVNGLDMLIYQGAKALEIWTGKVPDVQTMKIAALEAL
ncbi:shikimate dehydrogenase [bacterium]|nr:shikimate dehydrogenase [bacterium]